jgi:O-methyltransferase
MSAAKTRYINLLKQALNYGLWDEPPKPAALQEAKGGLLSRYMSKRFLTAVREQGLVLMKPVEVTAAQREEGLIWPGYADTMIGMKRMNNLQLAIETVLKEGVKGDFLEAGVWRGGASILMRGILAAHEVTDRTVYVADSFAGLPPPDEDKYPADRGDKHHENEYLAVSLEEVKRNFQRYELLDEQVTFLKGWFSDTLPAAPINKLAVLRADGDMYSSTMDILENLYPKLAVGGFCIIDDYGAIPACKKAVDTYRQRHDITDTMIEIDWTGRYWRKS